MPLSFPPPLTAIISGWSGVKALLLRLVQWRVGLRWYAVALLLPVILWGAAVSLSVLLVGLLHASLDTFGDRLTAPKVIPTGNPLIVDMTGLTSAVLLVIVMLIVYGVFKRSTRVEDAEWFIHPQGDGTWRDWLR